MPCFLNMGRWCTSLMIHLSSWKFVMLEVCMDLWTKSFGAPLQIFAQTRNSVWTEVLSTPQKSCTENFESVQFQNRQGRGDEYFLQFRCYTMGRFLCLLKCLKSRRLWGSYFLISQLWPLPILPQIRRGITRTSNPWPLCLWAWA